MSWLRCVQFEQPKAILDLIQTRNILRCIFEVNLLVYNLDLETH